MTNVGLNTVGNNKSYYCVHMDRSLSMRTLTVLFCLNNSHLIFVKYHNEQVQAEVNELIKSEVGENKSAIELRGQAVFDRKRNGSAIYTIKIGINWNGQYFDDKFMMGAEVKNGKVVTKIGFSVNTFGIFNPFSGKLDPAFVIVNGQVVICEAFINKAVIGSIVVQTDNPLVPFTQIFYTTGVVMV